MAVKTAKNGVIILAPGDTYARQASKTIYGVVVTDDSGAGQGSLDDFSTNVLLPYIGDGATTKTVWFGLGCCVSTGNGLINNATNATFYVYVR